MGYEPGPVVGAKGDVLQRGANVPSEVRLCSVAANEGAGTAAVNPDAGREKRMSLSEVCVCDGGSVPNPPCGCAAGGAARKEMLTVRTDAGDGTSIVDAARARRDRAAADAWKVPVSRPPVAHLDALDPVSDPVTAARARRDHATADAWRTQTPSGVRK